VSPLFNRTSWPSAPTPFARLPSSSVRRLSFVVVLDNVAFSHGGLVCGTAFVCW